VDDTCGSFVKRERCHVVGIEGAGIAAERQARHLSTKGSVEGTQTGVFVEVGAVECMKRFR
jgi:hypothetical protein